MGKWSEKERQRDRCRWKHQEEVWELEEEGWPIGRHPFMPRILRGGLLVIAYSPINKQT